ncbi:MAG TPA: DHH family phosphoesterase [Planctomycetota bacterium]|jgi:phosphoesterase RecJ-like protein|nr:DHH family phosphoesterase [Planctomycetota bacterium]
MKANRTAAEILRQEDRFLITGHVRADGDCLGAEVALWHLARALGKEATIFNPDPVAERYSFLKQGTPFRAFDPARGPEQVPPFDVLFVCDVAVLSRTGPLEPILRARPALRVCVDHHVPERGESWDAAYVDESAPASGYLVWRLALEMGVRLPREALEAVFVAITTDTGWFRYSNTSAAALSAAAEIVAAGVDVAGVYRRVFQQFPPQWPSGIAALLGTLRYHAEGALAVVAIDRKGLRDRGVESLEDPDEVLDILRCVGPVEVVLYLRELDDGRVKGSLRSKGDFDVNAFARRFGGGGHKKAAGFELPGPFEARVPPVEGAAEEAVAAWRTERGR